MAAILRYPETEEVISNQDPFTDVLDWLGFLTATDYLTSLLRTRHGLAASAAASRAKQIIPHVATARDYIQQSLDGPPAIAFLPAYYAILNLMKVYILLGPRHADLKAHRWHGATYDVHSKDSHSIVTEVVNLKKGGVFPLFYETITGRALTANELSVRLSDILPYVSGVTHEYHLATGKPSRLVALELAFRDQGGRRHPTFRVHSTAPTPIAWKVRDLKVLRGFRTDPADPVLLVGRRVNEPTEIDDTRQQLRPHLIYRVSSDFTVTPVCSRHMELPEELPIALLFFYMSSISRYKPEFFIRVRTSRFWPLLAVSRRHSFHVFLMAFWSFMQRRNHFLHADAGQYLT